MEHYRSCNRAVGVYICHCGTNIAGTVDVRDLRDYASGLEGVVLSRDHMYMCSEPGQALIKEDIEELGLDAIVVAACSPRMHEPTFRVVLREAGLNPYCLEIVNIREQCSWVHRDEKEMATRKARDLIRMAVSKAVLLEPLDRSETGVVRKAMVIGGGIAGIQSALDLANSGHKTYLVEREPTIGGRMAQLDKTFPTLDCSSCILTPRMTEVKRHENIELMSYSEVVKVEGYVGNFNVTVRKKPRYVHEDRCNTCNKCAEVCPVVVPDEFDEGLGPRKAIYLPFPQAVPQVYVLDEHACLGLLPLACSKCREVCEPGAIDYDQQPVEVDIAVGTIIVATGYDIMPKSSIGEYGYGKYRNVITGLEFERLLSASGPTGGKILRPSDGKVPKEVVFIQCVGSRDPEHGVPYCSKICCMYTAKHASMYKHAVPRGQAYVFYIDIRSGGKGYEEFVQRIVEEDKVLYLRGKVSKIFEEDEKIVVWGVDTLTGKKVEIMADLVVLATAILPGTGAEDTGRLLGISSDANGFFLEAHPKLRPVDTFTEGIFLAGCCQGPKDIPETVAQASAAAARALAILSKEFLEIDPLTSAVDESVCRGCGFCVDVCPYDAVKLEEISRNGHPVMVANVNEVLCRGCGSCSAACLSGAIQLRGSNDAQILASIEALGGIGIDMNGGIMREYGSGGGDVHE